MKNSIDTLNTKLDSINVPSSDDFKLLTEQVTTLTKKFDDLVLSQTTNKDKAKASEIQARLDAKKCLLRTSKSVDEILRYCNEFKCVQSENYISCVYCNTGSGNLGQFSYDFSMADDFRDKPSPRPFLNLKKVLVSHI